MNQLSRRDFLAAGVIAGASPLFALEESKPSFSFALVTDTHLGKPGADYVKRMQQAVTEINASPAEFTIFCGDLVDRGEEEARQKLYPQWVEIAKGLKKDWRAVPGNHDPAAMFQKHIAESTENELQFKNWRFLTFADAEPNPGHMGVVTPEQLDWLKDRLADARKKKQRVVLAAHVIYRENKHPDVGWYIKTGRENFGKVLQANKHIAAMFGGHLHCGMRGWSDTFHGIHEVILPCVSYNNDRKLDKVTGFALKEFRPAWVLVDVFEKKLMLNYKPVGAEVAISKELPLN